MPLAVVMLGRSSANLIAPRRLMDSLRMILNGDAGWRPTLAAIGWSFVLDALEYGRARYWVSGRVWWAYLQVGSPVKLVTSAHVLLLVRLAGVRVGRGPPRTRWL